MLPADLQAGDLLAMPVADAYQRSMASSYNLVPHAAVVAVAGGRSRPVLRRERVDDLLRLEP